MQTHRFGGVPEAAKPDANRQRSRHFQDAAGLGSGSDCCLINVFDFSQNPQRTFAGTVLAADLDYLHRAFDERIWASINAIRVLGERLAKDGSITFISGSLADRPNAYGTAVLAAASAAMEAPARALALELAPVRVNTPRLCYRRSHPASGWRRSLLRDPQHTDRPGHTGNRPPGYRATTGLLRRTG